MFSGSGNWNLWEEWSACDVTCEGGARQRNRVCDAPAPENGGKFCLGFKRQVSSCNAEPCEDQK